MDDFLYCLHAARGNWPNQLGPDLINAQVGGSTQERAIANAQRMLSERFSTIPYDHAWLKNDDGWTVWASTEEGYPTSK